MMLIRYMVLAGAVGSRPGCTAGPRASRPPGRLRGRRGFTLAELLVSVAIMSLLLLTVGMVFAMSTKATSLSNANNEVMNNVRALEQQLRQDFRGLRKDGFLGICYNHLPARRVSADRAESAAVRSDWIVFFANGDFHTIRQRWDATSTPKSFYGPNAMPIRSNLARIAYGMLGTHDSVADDTTNSGRPLAQISLGRFAKLMIPDLVPDPNRGVTPEDPPDYGSVGNVEFTDASAGGIWDKTMDDVYENWEYEYETLAAWRDPGLWPATPTEANMPSYATHLMGRLLEGANARNNLWFGLGYIDVTRAKANHLPMIPGCTTFKIERWAETDPVDPADASWVPRWWPEEEDSRTANGAAFGPNRMIWECFNGPMQYADEFSVSPIPSRAQQPGDWPQRMNDVQPWPWITRDFSQRDANDPRRAVYAPFPKALRITVSLMDTNRRLLESVRSGTRLTRTVPGTQTFTIVIPLD